MQFVVILGFRHRSCVSCCWLFYYYAAVAFFVFFFTVYRSTSWNGPILTARRSGTRGCGCVAAVPPPRPKSRVVDRDRLRRRRPKNCRNRTARYQNNHQVGLPIYVLHSAEWKKKNNVTLFIF